MNEQDTRPQIGHKTPSVSRRVFLTKGTHAAAGLTAGSALLAATSSATLADHERLRSVAILRKPPVTLTFTIFGASADAITWRKLADLFHSQNQGIKVNVLAFSAPDWSTYFEKVLTLVAGGVRRTLFASPPKEPSSLAPRILLYRLIPSSSGIVTNLRTTSTTSTPS